MVVFQYVILPAISAFILVAAVYYAFHHPISGSAILLVLLVAFQPEQPNPALAMTAQFLIVVSLVGIIVMAIADSIRGGGNDPVHTPTTTPARRPLEDAADDAADLDTDDVGIEHGDDNLDDAAVDDVAGNDRHDYAPENVIEDMILRMEANGYDEDRIERVVENTVPDDVDYEYPWETGDDAADDDNTDDTEPAPITPDLDAERIRFGR